MANSGRGKWVIGIAAILVVAGIGGYLAYRAARGTTGPYMYRSATAPTTQPASATQPTTKPDKPVLPPASFIDVVRATYPKYSTTQPLDLPVRELSEAARILLRDPVYLGPSYRPDLWITRADAAPMQEVLKKAMDPKADVQVHVVPDKVRFVHWNPGDKGWTPFVVVEGAGDTLEVVSPTTREPLATQRAFDWARAISWNEKIVVPSKTGVSIFRFTPKLTEDFHALLPSEQEAKPHAAPVALLDFQGLLAWIPAENGQPGSVGAARYVDDKWTDLGPEQGWPEQILHLVPLLDGSVLQIAAQDSDAVKLTVATLFKVEVDEGAITALVEQMSDPDADQREAAFKKLSQYGPGAYSVLEKLAGTQPPEARARLRALLRNQVQPTLGGMTLLGNTLKIVSRHDDGGAVFFAEAGVSIPREDTQPMRRVPAWLSVRPGKAAEVLDAYFIRELNPEGCEVIAMGNEWLVTGDAPGPRRWVGNGFVPLLKKDERVFSQLLGIDARGRWLFRKPGNAEETLILDPRLPDPTPRLPVWEYTQAKEFGWDQSDWPAVKREGGHWSLRDRGWKLLDLTQSDRFNAEDRNRNVFDADSTSASAGWSSIASRAKPLLTRRDGTRYFDGLTALRVTNREGKTIVWPLPPAATGKGIPTLVQTDDGTLFLFNQPGRVLRIRATPDEREPFTIDATFTEKIPSVETPKRIWLDPAGRIVIADNRRLILLFPEGFIPPRIRDLMPLDQSRDERD